MASIRLLAFFCERSTQYGRARALSAKILASSTPPATSLKGRKRDFVCDRCMTFRAETDIDIEFVTENGDLPLIKSGTTFLLMDVSDSIESFVFQHYAVVS